MIDKKQINNWVSDGTITHAQAKKMLADVQKDKQDRTSDKLIMVMSTIGVILLGIGAILLIASNWMFFPDFVKVLIFAAATFGTGYLGYLFKYDKKNLPKVGGSLMLLGALLFGATIFLIAQIYNINANSHVLVLIWLLGILPLVYALKSEVMAGLSALLFLVWFGLFLYRGISAGRAFDDIAAFPLYFLITGLFLFGVGGLHYASDSFKGIARMFRIIGLKLGMICLFILTFRFMTGSVDNWNLMNEVSFSSSVAVNLTVFSILTLFVICANLFFNFTKNKSNFLEHILAIVVIAVTLLFFYFPLPYLYLVLFTGIFIGIVSLLIYVGYVTEDITLVNIGLFWAGLFVIVKYFDYFGGLLPRSISFIAGGIVFVMGGIALEKKRRQLKLKFTKNGASVI